MLLDGPAGTGKMTAVRAVCDLLKRPILTMYGDESHFGTDQIASLMSVCVICTVKCNDASTAWLFLSLLLLGMQ